MTARYQDYAEFDSDDDIYLDKVPTRYLRELREPRDDRRYAHASSD